MNAIQPRHPVVILVILAAMTALMPLSIDMYLPAFPNIAADLHTSTANVGFSLTSFFIGISLGQLFYGWVADRYGRKFPIYIGLSLGAVASLVCAFVPNIHALIVLRFIQALGVCAGVVASRAIVRDLYDHNEAARFFSLLMAVMGITPILAPIAGGYVSDYLGWRAIFIIIAVASMMCLFASTCYLAETHGGNHHAKLSRIFHTYFDILKDRSFIRLAFTGSLTLAGMFCYITASPRVLIEVYGLSPQQYSLVFGSNALGLIACSQLNRWLLNRYPFASVLKGGIIALTIGGASLALLGLMQHPPLPALLAGIFIFVSSIGIASPNSLAGAMAEQGARAGSASALAGCLQFATAVISSGLVGSFQAASHWPMCLVVAACAALAFCVFFFVKVPESLI